MTAPLLLLTTFLALGTAEDLSPPPLTEGQKAKLRSLVRTTTAERDRLKARLEECQRELARLYAEYELDTAAARKLQEEVLDLQKQLLTNYHQMHVELRSIVGRERFEVLRRRIDNALNPPRQPEKPKKRSPR